MNEHSRPEFIAEPAGGGLDTAFRLAALSAVAVRLPLERPIKMAGVTIAASENVIVRIIDDLGQIGWGEACSAPTMTGETAAGMLAAIRYLQPQIEGAAIADLAQLPLLLDRLLYGNWAAKSAIEMATYDLVGRRLGLPVYALLGGRRRRDIPVLFMLAAGDMAAEAKEARKKFDLGFRAFKVKVGTGRGLDDVARDLERTANVRAAVGAGAQISADANQGYSRAEGLAFAADADLAILDFFEQPVMAGDLASMRAIAEASRVPIGADEGIHGLSDIERHAAQQAAHGVSLKTIKLGGLSGVMEAGRICERSEMKVNLAGKVADSSIASAAIAHLATALPRIEWGVSVTNQYLSEDVTAAPLRVRRGHVAPAEAPGLGIEVDETRVGALSFTPDL